MKKAKIEQLFGRLREQNPQPTTELEYRTPFQLLVAVVLSAQATDKSVNLATKKLFQAADSPEKIYALGEESLKDHIRTIGLFNSKAKNLVKTCAILLEDHRGQVPQTREQLETLPGVGRKTANVIMNTAFGAPTIAVDTHIFRVANRTGLARGRTPLAVETELLKAVPDAFLRDAHHWLLLHGRYVCIARRPKCGACIINDLCDYEGKSGHNG
jgi:endonuclease-3